MLFSFVNFLEGSSISNSSEVMNGDIFCRGKDEIFVIKNDPQCSNQYCKRKNHTNINMKHRHRLYASARQMEEDVSKHLLKDAPHGDQVIFRNVCFIAKINNFTYCYGSRCNIPQFSNLPEAAGINQRMHKDPPQQTFLGNVSERKVCDSTNQR